MRMGEIFDTILDGLPGALWVAAVSAGLLVFALAPMPMVLGGCFLVLCWTIGRYRS